MNTKPLLNVKAIARYLDVSVRTVYTYKNSGKLPPSHKMGGKRVWLQSDLDTWIKLGMPSLDKFLDLTSEK